MKTANLIMTEVKPIQVLFISDNNILSESIRTLFTNREDLMLVLGKYETDQTYSVINEFEPKVILLDATIPRLTHFELMNLITSHSKYRAVIVLSPIKDWKMVSDILQVGALGYLTEEADFDMILQAIRSVLADKIYLSSTIQEMIIDSYIRNVRIRKKLDLFHITRRETEIVQMIAAGKSTKEIATELKLSTKTVETHRRNIMAKLNLRSIAELTKYAVRHGLSPYN